MSKAIAKRRLKDSYYAKMSKESTNKKARKNDERVLPISIKDISMNSLSDDYINGLYRRNGANNFYNTTKKETEQNSFFKKLKQKYLMKLAIQSITMIAILVFCLCVKYMNIKIITSSEICKKILNEFRNNYTKEQIIDFALNIWDKTYAYIDPIIPDELSQKTVAVFSNMFKKIEKNSEKLDIYSEKNIQVYSEPVASVEEPNNNILEVSSSVENLKVEDSIVEKIKNSNVEFIKPTSGVITSKYGERDPIFSGVESYHYGTDIANVEGTPIYSSIDGKVVTCSTNNETGNYIEIENGSIVTRYCHLSVQLVSVGENVKKGQLIGKMGKTGMATGSHLHFEIMYNRERVDAQKILKLD